MSSASRAVLPDLMKRWGGGGAVAVLLLLTMLVYWPGLTGPFLFDDFPALVSNKRLHVQGGDWKALWSAAASFEQIGTGRPLVMLTFALNYALDGLHPWGWKFGGVLVHLLNAGLVYLLCRRLLALAGVGQFQRSAAGAIALLWAIHPLQISAVLYVVQRMETLSLTFVLLALLAYLRGRQRQISGQNGWFWLLLAALLALLSLGSKETGALFPLYTLVLELTLLGFSGHSVAQSRFLRWGYSIAIGLAGLLYVGVLVPHYAADDAFAIRDYSAWERVLSQLRVLPMYLAQIVFPVPHSMPFYYDDFVPSRSFLEPLSTLWGGLFLLGILSVALWLRRIAPLFSLGVLWFFAAHAMTSNVISLELVFEHRNYFALLGVLFALADLVRRIPTRDGPAIKVVAVAVVIVGVGSLGMVRSATWGEGLLLATENAALNPQSARAAQDLGAVYYAMSGGSVDSPFFSFAVHEFSREMELPQATILGEQSLILMHAGRGLEVDPKWWDRLLWRLHARPISAETTGGLFKLLETRFSGTELDDVALSNAFLIMFDRMLLPPYSYALVAEHARVYRGDPALSDHLLRMAVDRSDEHPEYVEHLAGKLYEAGQVGQAEMVLTYAKQRRNNTD